MQSHGQDAFRLLYDRAPIWLAHLKIVGDGTARRQGVPVPTQPSPLLSSFDSTPLLCDQPGTTLDPSALTTIGSSRFQLRQTDSNSPRAAQPLSPRAGRKRSRSESPTPSPRSNKYRVQHAAEVLYDSEAQDMLTDIVKDVAKVVYAIRKASPHTKLDQMSKRLQEAADTVEDAAFQILRDGDCASLALSATAVFQDLFNMSFKEVMYDLIYQRQSHNTLPPDSLTSQETASSDKSIPTAEMKQPQTQPVQVISIQAEDLDVDDEAEDDEDDENIPLPPLRLTSRLTPR